MGFSRLKNHVTRFEMGFDLFIYFENHMGLDIVAVIYELRDRCSDEEERVKTAWWYWSRGERWI